MKSPRIRHCVADELRGVIAAGQTGVDDQVIKERNVGVGVKMYFEITFGTWLVFGARLSRNDADGVSSKKRNGSDARLMIHPAGAGA
jgi:hypothetical protein